MLKKLFIKNFALIEEIEIDFNEGLTVLTGKTGAGKSLIIDTIFLLLGNRAESEMINDKASFLEVKGIFTINNKSLIKELNLSDNELIIYRKVSKDKSNIIKINGENSTLLRLKQISEQIFDIHTQFDTYKLLNKESYLDILDNYDIKIKKYIEAYQLQYFDYLNKLKDYKNILKKEKDLSNKLDNIKFIYNEIKTLNLNIDDYNEMISQEKILSNFDSIFQVLNEVNNIFENEYFNYDQIYDANIKLKKIENFDESFKDFSNRLSNIYYDLDDIISSIKSKLNNLDFNSETLDLISEKINNIELIKKKYNKSIEELIYYEKELELEIQLSENFNEVLNEHYNLLNKSFNDLKNLGIQLSNYRKEVAKTFEKDLIDECKNLELENIKFEVSFNDLTFNDPLNNIFSDKGMDDIDFLVSFNKGESIKPLAKIASGGELSRIMLVLKALKVLNSSLSLLILDEIDVGVSGTTANKIAGKIYEISKKTQTIAISHLPQVAGIADYQIKLNKIEEDNKTYITYNYLTYEERIKEISLMISGDYSVFSLETAKSLIKNKKTFNS